MNTIETLTAEIENITATIQQRESDIATLKALLDMATQKRKALQLDAFWEANPGLRIEIGDELTVTPEYVANVGAVNDYDLKAGEGVVVMDIGMKRGKFLCEWADRSAMAWGFPLEYVRTMRQAWLDKNG